MSAPTSNTTLTIGDASIPVTTSGTPGEPAILWLHGTSEGAADASSWDWLISDLADHFHNIAPDLNGIADPDGIAAATEARVAAALGVLDHFELTEAAVVGHAAGGLVALRLAGQSPERITHLVLEGTDSSGEILRALGLSDDALAAIAQPTVIVHGRDDPNIPVSSARFYAGRLGDAQLHVFPEAGHAVHLDKPQEFAVLVRNLLRSEEDELDPDS